MTKKAVSIWLTNKELKKFIISIKMMNLMIRKAWKSTGRWSQKSIGMFLTIWLGLDRKCMIYPNISTNDNCRDHTRQTISTTLTTLCKRTNLKATGENKNYNKQASLICLLTLRFIRNKSLRNPPSKKYHFLRVERKIRVMLLLGAAIIRIQLIARKDPLVGWEACQNMVRVVKVGIIKAMIVKS